MWFDTVFLLRTKYYADNKLIYRGLMHNIYVRVKVLRMSGNSYYSLVVDGYKLDVAYHVTRMPSSRPDKFTRLGRRLAANLGINFFDYEDSSTHHIVRHRYPDIVNSAQP